MFSYLVMKMKNKLYKWLFTLPVIIYSLVLIFLPLVYILIISFYKNDSYGGMIRTLTLSNYIQLFDLVYIKIFLQSLFYFKHNYFIINLRLLLDLERYKE